MPKYILHWMDGSTSEVEGESCEDAMTKAGYGWGAMRALDYWEKEDEENELSTCLY